MPKYRVVTEDGTVMLRNGKRSTADFWAKHWNGTGWRVVVIPEPADSDALGISVPVAAGLLPIGPVGRVELTKP